MELKKLRDKIDLVDYEILKLINQRMEFVLRLKKLKNTITDPERELEIYQNIKGFSSHLLKSEVSESIFQEIIKESKRIQESNLKVIGFQGEHGAYSEIAALTYDSSFIPIPCLDFVEVFDGIKNNQLDSGIVPVENSLEGPIAQVTALLIETDLKIVGEINIPIHHCLLALKDTDYRDIRVVYSHPQALSQCHNFIVRNKLEPVPYYDTAGAAKMLAREQIRSAAVIANNLCAKLYNLEVIKENIEDHESNITRFVILTSEASKSTGNKCSIIFSTRHEAGALFKILKTFSDSSINLTRIESRPIRNDPGRYAFLLDFQGSDSDKKVKDVIEKIKNEVIMFKFMGCYKEYRR
ncbi:MAG: prephenate dehydratase [Planctomycetota bacterium]|nr:prephenate dehydratase [Planctomycetota bacterium]MDI6788202.1 prephenate dehydratase [Planctomycetota bacterium]